MILDYSFRFVESLRHGRNRVLPQGCNIALSGHAKVALSGGADLATDSVVQFTRRLAALSARWQRRDCQRGECHDDEEEPAWRKTHNDSAFPFKGLESGQPSLRRLGSGR
jgi:hypothetical protein